MKFICFFLLFSFLGCQYQQKQRSIEEPINAKESLEIVDSSALESSSVSDQMLVGDSLLCSQYSRLAPLHKIVLDTLNRNPLQGLRIASRLHFEVKIEECLSGSQDIYSREIILDNGMEISFMDDNNSKNKLLTVVNQRLFSLRKLFGEMFSRDSEMYFHYDGAKLYRLSDGNLLLVEQPSSWCGSANVFDFYQYFDLTEREIVQFVEKDGFVSSLK